MAHRFDSKANGDNLRLRSLDDEDDTDEEERKTNRKHAWFFGIVAILFVLTNELGHVKDASDSNSSPVSPASASLTLSAPERTGNSGEFTMQFALSNKGNHLVLLSRALP